MLCWIDEKGLFLKIRTIHAPKVLKCPKVGNMGVMSTDRVKILKFGIKLCLGSRVDAIGY